MEPRIGRFVVMGVAGVGKTGVGTALAEALGGRFVEGDDLHSEASRAKMAGGSPLTDEDRWPWLDRVGEALGEGEPPVVVACSALKRRYRDRLRAHVPDLILLHLTGEPALVRTRMEARKGHYMPPSLLQSQYEALEPLERDERGIVLPVDRTVAEIVDAALSAVARL